MKNGLWEDFDFSRNKIEKLRFSSMRIRKLFAENYRKNCSCWLFCHFSIKLESVTTFKARPSLFCVP